MSGRRAGFGPVVAFLLVALTAVPSPNPVHGADGVVRAVLFYSPGCPHCYQVLTVDLPPIQDRFGDRFRLAAIDVSEDLGARLYESAVLAFDVPSGRIGVPTVVIADEVLVGSLEIPARLPALIDDGIAQGGIDWPQIPGLADALASPSPAPTREPASPTADVASGEVDLSPSAIAERYGRDPLGSTLAVIVLVGLLLVATRAAAGLWASSAAQPRRRSSAWIGVAALVGLGSAAYLAGVELTSTTAVCGPVGDCNAVHSSAYARVFGIPVGVLGVAGYLAILGCWLVSRHASGATALAGQLGLFLLAIGGAVFSAYLTVLEPFVIGATCSWCLGSAVAMGAILYLTPTPVLAGMSGRRAA